MARQFSVPSAPAVYTTSYKDFKGVDYRAEETTCDRTRFPDAQNIIIDGTGFPEKRVGWRKLINIDDIVEGICSGYVNNRKETILQIGGKLYRYVEDKTGEKPYVLEQIPYNPSNIDDVYTVEYDTEVKTYNYFQFIEILSPLYYLNSSKKAVMIGDVRVAPDGTFYRVDRKTMTIKKQKETLSSELFGKIEYNYDNFNSEYGTIKHLRKLRYSPDNNAFTMFTLFSSFWCFVPEQDKIYEIVQNADDGTYELYEKFFDDKPFEEEYDSFLEGESNAVCYDGKMYILNSKGYFVYDGESVKECKGTNAYAPVVTTQRNYVSTIYKTNYNSDENELNYIEPGNTYEKVNLLSNVRCDEFATVSVGTQTLSERRGYAKNYMKLSSEYASDILCIEILTGENTWEDITDYFFNAMVPWMSDICGGAFSLYSSTTDYRKYFYITDRNGKCAVINELMYIEGQNGGTVSGQDRIPKPFVSDGVTNNIRITYTVSSESFEENYKRIRDCDTITKYGVTEEDRIFLTGNDDFKNYVWYSEFQNPLYIPDLNYITVGYDNTAVVGFLKFQDYLVALKEKTTDDTNIFLVKGEMTDEGALFKVRSGMQGVGAISNKGFAYADDEPLFLAGNGVFALQTVSISQERNVANRSGFINQRFETEEGKETATMCRWRNYIIIALNNHAYVLNVNQKTYTDDIGAGYYKTYYYEASFWDNIPATDFFLINDELYFYHNSVTGEGSFIAKFNSDIKDVSKYNDVSLSETYTKEVLGIEMNEGPLHDANKPKPIDAWFKTKADDDGSFMVLKTMVKRGCGIMIKPYTRSSAEIYVITDKEEKDKPVKTAKAGMLDFSDFDFSLISFNTRDVATIIPLNTKVKKYSTLQFMVRNNEISQGLGVLGIEKRYKMGSYKKY